MTTRFLPLVALLLAGCSDPRIEEAEKRWDGDVIVKICVDGTHIYRLKDGDFVTGGLGAARVENPETVCAQK